jgi:hypothetical protein
MLTNFSSVDLISPDYERRVRSLRSRTVAYQKDLAPARALSLNREGVDHDAIDLPSSWAACDGGGGERRRG